MREEDTLLKKRLMELARQCERRDIPVFSHFLNLNEQTVFHRSEERRVGKEC